MKFFVNCSNLTSGGGLTVGLGIVTSLLKLKTDHFVVFIPNICEYSNFKNTGNVHFISNKPLFLLQKIFLEYRLARYAKQYECNRILSLSNYALPTNVPQTLLIHWPYAVYPEKEFWGKMSSLNRLKRKIRFFKMKLLLKFTSSIIVQTSVMKERALLNLGYSKKINVIPSASGFLGNEINEEVRIKIDTLKEEGNKVFLCINEYYEHKNLEILLPVAELVRKCNINYSFIITLAENEKSLIFLNQVKKRQLQDIIVNVGRVKRDETKALYGSCDALFFPSLIESFGIPLVEAQEMNLPVYTSNKDFAHVICKEHAIYFDPSDPLDIVDKLNQTVHTNKDKIINSWDEIIHQMLNTLR